MGECVFVTGATGFLGTALCRELVSNGQAVTAMRRQSSQTGALAGVDVDWVTADVLDAESVHRSIAGHETVYHLAGIGLLDADEQTVWDVNVRGTKNVVDACESTGVERLLFTSTAGTRRRSDGPATEADVAEPIGAYQTSKTRAEEVVSEYAANGNDAVIARPTPVFGLGDQKFTERLLSQAVGSLPVSPPGGVSVVHVDDAVDGLVRSMQRGKPGEEYIIGGDNKTFIQLLRLLADAGGGVDPKVRIPPLFVRLAGVVVGVINTQLGTRFFPVNADMADLATRTLFHSSAKAERELGYRWKPVQTYADEILREYTHR